MNKVTKTITTELEIYIANDGEEFMNESHCLLHEWRCDANVIYAVNIRGSRNMAEAYSTRELAERACEGSEIHYVVEVYLDERFWNEWQWYIRTKS